jgi:hypothetical protein
LLYGCRAKSETQTMHTATSTRCRGLQFGLGTMLVTVTIFAALLARDVNWMHERQAFVAQQQQAAEARGVAVSFADMPSPPGLLGLFHEHVDRCVFVICEATSESTLTTRDIDQLREAQRLFPDAKIAAVHHIATQTGSTTSVSTPNFD